MEKQKKEKKRKRKRKRKMIYFQKGQPGIFIGMGILSSCILFTLHNSQMEYSRKRHELNLKKIEVKDDVEKINQYNLIIDDLSRSENTYFFINTVLMTGIIGGFVFVASKTFNVLEVVKKKIFATE